MEKRSFGCIRRVILRSLLSDNNSINSISRSSNINWKTCENHLNYLCGRGLVEEIFSSEYVRMFRLTDEGMIYLKETKDDTDYDHKDVNKIMKEISVERRREELKEAYRDMAKTVRKIIVNEDSVEDIKEA